MEYSRKEKGPLKRLIDGVKEYYGPMPVLSGLIVAGAAGTAAFALSAIYNTGNGVVNTLTNGSIDPVSILYKIPETIGRIYTESRSFASNWTMPGFLLGQFAGYKLKKTIKSWFKKK